MQQGPDPANQIWKHGPVPKCSPKVLETLIQVRHLVRRIRDYDPHPSQCDHIHLHATEAIEMLEIAIAENSAERSTP